MTETTIAAVSTAYGQAGIGVVRLSGPDASLVASRIFVPASGRDGFEFVPRYMHYGRIEDPKSGEVVDEVLCVLMKAPHSYTGEDVAEIQCHGSSAALSRILSLCLENGAVCAERGEFTRRAFMNGRLDLSRAEAVIDLIKAPTQRGLVLASKQLQGSIYRKISELRRALLDVLAELTVNMDYPDEDIEQLTLEKISNSLSPISDELLKLVKESEEGRLVREGLAAAIVGRPNVGKSSLMNALLRTDRSIVTDVPGTTRDTIEEQASIRGVPVRLVDTAGIRSSQDPVESIGIERSRQALAGADLTILVVDASSPLREEDEEIIAGCDPERTIAVLNKQDLGAVVSRADIEELLPGARAAETSLGAEASGLEELRSVIADFTGGGRDAGKDDPLLSNVRHIDLVKRALSELREAEEAAGAGQALDLIEINVRAAFVLLGEITGETASAEIIDEVFSRFCLGK